MSRIWMLLLVSVVRCERVAVLYATGLRELLAVRDAKRIKHARLSAFLPPLLTSHIYSVDPSAGSDFTSRFAGAGSSRASREGYRHCQFFGRL
jgi:hypothetical protein